MTAHLCPPTNDDPSPDRRDESDGRRPRSARADPDGTADDEPTVAVDELLSLLGDEYACDILRALADESRPARALIDECGMSRPTVYRRLDRLTDAGLVEARTAIARDGHHRKEFSLVVDEIELRLGADGIDGRVAAADAASD